MKKIMIWIFLLTYVLHSNVQAEEKPEQLYAQSAVLMDADSGRVLFEKNGTDRKAMASTTKIVTCILALEYGEENMVVTFSKNAQSQPKVHLGAKEGEQFYLKDLLHSLMLESHNDSAVAIAEAIAGDVKSFAKRMNEKAKEIGCNDTYFITPNGLDASDENGIHSTTAVDLAKIMSYCIMESPKKERFLEITAIASYQFQNLQKNRTYSCNNHNTFLSMMEEAITGKTGFTSEAGYCYVGAVESEGRTFVVSLLACGWPNNKTYKWSDMEKLITYGMENYKNRTEDIQINLEDVFVEEGIHKSEDLFKKAYASLMVKEENRLTVLMRDDEKIEFKPVYKRKLKAPVKKGESVGVLYCYMNGEEMASFPIVTKDSIGKRIFSWCFGKITELYAL